MLLLVLIATLFAPACKKKRPQLPQQSQPPSATQPEKPSVESLPPSTLPATVTATPAPPPKPRPRRVHRPPATANGSKPSAAVPAKPGTTPTKPNPDPLAISPDTSGNSSPAQRQSAEQLLASAQNNMNRINRTLNDQEQSMRQQVTNYIRQSRLALNDGDVERGYNLALKASQLSNELVK